jgi:toxin ParE1/3/4
MIFDIEVSAQADNDIRNIYEYIAYELQSPENAKGQLERLEKSILSLDQMPERFRAYEKEPWQSRGLRIMPVNNYCVLYIPDAEKAVVTIIRVMYGGRDIETQLQKYTKM